MSNNLMTMFVQDTVNTVREQNKYTAQSKREVNNLASSSGKDSSSQVTASGNNDGLGKDAFLQLLVTQLKYQDPLSPMENGEFIAQMAQFSSLEQMQNMNKNMEGFLRIETLNQGASLIGRTIETINPDTGEVISGEVEKVYFERGAVYAYLDNDYIVDINYITAVN